MTNNNNPMSVTYTDAELRNLVEEYITQQKFGFTLKGVCSYILYWAVEDDKVAQGHSPIVGNAISNADQQRVKRLLEDQYLYFEGCSEKELNKIKINGTNLLKKKLTEEEQAYKLRQEKDVGTRRPDVLLYPAEGKCIIVEFKAPDVEVSQHLDQINRYAMINC